jgi:hypothetical protein
MLKYSTALISLLLYCAVQPAVHGSAATQRLSTLKGCVRGTGDKVGLGGYTVLLSPRKDSMEEVRKIVTDSKGKYRFEKLGEDRYLLEVRKGSELSFRDIVHVGRGENTKDVMLRPLPVTEQSHLTISIERVIRRGKVPKRSARFYTIVRIGDLRFKTRDLRPSNDLQPNWAFEKLADRTLRVIPITIEIWDSGAGPSGQDVKLDINPTSNKKSVEVSVNLVTSEVSGDARGKSGEILQLTGKHSDATEVWFRITSE